MIANVHPNKTDGKHDKLEEKTKHRPKTVLKLGELRTLETEILHFSNDWREKSGEDKKKAEYRMYI